MKESSPGQEPARSRAMAVQGSSASSGSRTYRAGRTSPTDAAGQCSRAISATISASRSGPSTASTAGRGRLRHQASGRSGWSRRSGIAAASLQRNGGTRSLRQTFIRTLHQHL
ncbi:hypothetical protein [Planomonospora algeriensis]